MLTCFVLCVVHVLPATPTATFFCVCAETATGYSITCTGEPLPASGLSVTLNVTQAPTAECPVSSVETATATVRTPPVASVDLSPVTKCSSETEITLDATVGTDTLVAVDVDVTPDFCKIDGQSSVQDGERNGFELIPSTVRTVQRQKHMRAVGTSVLE